MRPRRLVGPGLAVGAAVLVANALNALFQLVLARLLEPSEYGLLAALVVVVVIAAVPPVAFQASVAREVAVALADGARGQAGGSVRSAVRALLVAGVAVTAAGAVLYPWIGTAGVATAATAGAALAIPAAWGGLQGAEQFAALSAVNVVFSASRLAVGVGVAAAGGDTADVMVGVAAATVATLAVSLVPLRALLAAGRGVRRRVATLPNAAAAVGLTVLMALTGVDLIVAKLALHSEIAGTYAAASVGARVLLLVPIAVTTVVFPRVAARRDRAGERRLLLGTLATVAVLGALATAVLWPLGTQIVELVFGDDYGRAGDWLGPLALAMALYALTWAYLMHFLALGSARFALVLVALFAAQAIAYAVFHDAPRELIAVQLVTAAVSVVAAETWHALRHR